MPAVTAKEFLRALWGGQSGGVAELTTITKKPATEHHPRSSVIKSFGFAYPDSLDSLIVAAKNHNDKGADVYMGVCLRRSQWELGSRGTEELALSSNVVWLDIDFAGEGHKGKTIDKVTAQRMLHQFKLKPSIVVKTGGGIHVYWLLKEAALGAELHTVKRINKALIKHFSTDPVADLARILRIPGFPPFLNLKYSPHRPVEVSWWRPEHVYALKDFDFLPLEPEPPRFSLVPAAGPAPAIQQPQQLASPTSEPRVYPNLAISEDHVRKVGELLSQIWSKGYLHHIALHVAGWFANHQVVLDSAKRVIAIASDLKSGSTPDRLKDVEDTYKNFTLGKEVTGRTSLEKMIDTWDTEAARMAGRKTLQDIQKLLPKAPRKKKDHKSLEPDFTIPKIVKFDSRPARYQVTIRKEKEGEKDYVVECELEILTDIKTFRKHFFQTSINQFINLIPQPVWERMLSEAPVEVKPAPAEASVAGSLTTALDTWLDDKREKPQLGELKTFPGYNDDKIFFTLEGFKGRLKDRQIKATDREITHVLRDNGWQDDRIWVGPKNPRVWFKALSNGNGHGNGNGAPHTPPPSDLFPEPEKTPVQPSITTYPAAPLPSLQTTEGGSE